MTWERRKPVGEGKKLAVSLALCDSVGNRALASIWYGCCPVASLPYNNGTVGKLGGS